MAASFSIVIPAYNEENGIGPTLEKLRTLPGSPRIIVVNDGSTDGTAAVVKRFPDVSLLSHPVSGGYGQSLKTGIRHASTDIIVITDADGTYPSESIPALVADIDRGFDMAVGARQGKHYRGSFLKMPARIVFQWLVEFTTGRSIPDINSGLRAFRRQDVLAVEADLCNGFSFTTTLTLIEFLQGKFVHYRPIEYGARIGRTKVRIIRDSFRTLQYVIEAIAAYNPLKLYVLLSGFFGALALVALIISIVFRDLFSFLLGSYCLIGAAIMFGIGILAHLQARLARRHGA
jgi:glycosyltransferase involved in cell wall biosynthesis